MYIQAITLFPEMFSAICDYGVTSRALKNNIWQFNTLNLRDFSSHRLGYIDDRPFGGGPGMVIQAPPIQKALDSANKQVVGKKGKIVYLTPQGMPITHKKVVEFSQQEFLTILCGRYEGIDERILLSNPIEEVNVGDFVVSGGELPAMMLIDAVLRQLPGVLGDERSAQEDSFTHYLLDCPHYTRPLNFRGMCVPDVLLSGNHASITQWRYEQSLLRTRLRRPDLWQRWQNYCNPEESHLQKKD